AASGEARLDLKTANVSDIVDRTKVTTDQATAIQTYLDNNADATLGNFIASSLNRLAAQNNPTRPTQRIEALTNEQLAALLDETSIGPSTAGTQPGKLNVNTCP